MKEREPMRQLHRPLLVILAALALLAVACDDDGGGSSSSATDTGGSTEPADGGSDLVGLFAVDAGECADAGVTAGSYFRMVQPNGDPEDGPFVDNPDSSCGDTTFTALSPGADGGLITGEYQPQPEPPFEGDSQNGAADAIVQPQGFFAINFAVATNEVDPQTGDDVPPPSVSDASGTLTGDTSAWGVAYSGQHFNQGSPKPDGSKPGNTSGPTGSYDPDTGRYVLEWTSLIVGGPFDGFTGVWHLEGTFEAES
jgi:hypothetical protein